MVCGICAAPEKARYTIREGMFGTEEPFEYFECARCGCVQAVEIPKDLARFYPAKYYSLGAPAVRRRSVRRRLVDLWATEGRGGPLAALLYLHKPNPELRRLRALGIRKGDPILDVGAGGGHRVLAFRQAGFARAIGIDPHLDAEPPPDGEPLVRKLDLADVRGPFSLVMFNHSLEHMPDQLGALGHAKRVLAPGGVVLVRIPTVSSWAWEHYRERWAGCEAPRHLYLHSRESIRVLAARAGLAVERIEDESTSYQFWTSELRMSGLAIAREDGSLAVPPEFGARQIRAFERRARELNRLGRGDEIAVVMRAAS